MFDLLLTSGCSHTYGSGILKTDYDAIDKDNIDTFIKHPDLKKFFNGISKFDDAKKRLIELTWTGVLANELNVKKYYNLGIPGSGVDTQMRYIYSFIERNKNKINFSNSLFLYQVPSMTRVEFVTQENGKWRFTSSLNLEHDIDSDQLSKNLLLNHFDFDFYLSKNLNNLVFLKKYAESFGIIFKPFSTGSKKFNDLLKTYEYTYYDENKHIKRLNQFSENHYNIEFPELKNILNDLDFLLVDLDTPFGSPTTLIEDGYNNDYHNSPEGHEKIGKNLAYHLKKIGKYNLKKML